MPALTVQNAEIKTATVEVKTLTISGKQVTLAVFRQLQVAPWTDNQGNPRGQGWGRVNYCPEGRRCGADGWGDQRNHVHVVWQLGTELFRAFVHEYSPGWRAALDLPQLFIAV